MNISTVHDMSKGLDVFVHGRVCVHDREENTEKERETENVELASTHKHTFSTSLVPLCFYVFVCGKIGPVDTAEFMNASSQGKVKVIEMYLADGGNPNAQDELKRTALHRASLEGHTAAVQMLLEKGADINLKDQLGSRAIHCACRGGSLEVVKALTNKEADLNVRDKLNSTPLHVATRTGHTAIVEYLLSSGAKINSRDREGDTALHDAVRLNRYKIVKLLIAAEADTKIKNHVSFTPCCAKLVFLDHFFNVKETSYKVDVLR
uniref:Ankyrin repeat domain 2 (stretch responsive muscle) n=1 Tax=Acanthochromis polyacanthus TaxID=80966 RepID=A0A3Q1HXF0_9TELE